MKITVTGAAGKRAKDIEKAAVFYANKLMNKRLIKNLVIDIEVVSKLDGDEKGECMPDEEEGYRNPRYFTIRLKRWNKDGEDILQTLAHEMVHVKQYAKNELAFKPVYNKTKKSFTSKIDIYWNDTIWKNKKSEHEYWDAPW
jgi:hypothetical protein